MLLCRHSIFALLAGLGAALAAAASEDAVHTDFPTVTVVGATAVQAHRSAIDGIQAAFTKSPLEIHLVDLSRSGPESLRTERFAGPGTRVIVAIGTEALQLVAAQRPNVPVISTMLLRGTSPANKTGVPEVAFSPVATIMLDIPLPALLSRLKQVFPGKTRLGIIRNASMAGLAATELESRAQQQGFTVRVVDCPGAEQLLATLQALKGHVDFVWCLPDGLLYNSATIKPLILASIEYRLPLIGFSESFARAGAAVGVYPDFRDIGLQTGEIALQIAGGHAVRALEGPRKVKLALNQSVLRLIGLRYTPPKTDAEDFSLLQ
jgi:putative ABC transport system substrate-binding protein